MPAPKPVSITQVASSTGPAPEPLVIVGGTATAAAAGLVKRGVHVPTATVAADGTSAGNAINAQP